MQINSRTNVINYFITKYGYKSYLEIGVYDVNINFNKIIAEDKIGVDPNSAIGLEFTMRSDDFFKQNNKTFDIIFIDGLHESSQVYRDIVNSINVLNNGGTIILHDCNPTEEAIQQVPPIQGGDWTGDCWKAFVRFRTETQDYNMFVINIDYGVGVIRKSVKKLPAFIINEPLIYCNLDKNRIKWLNLIEANELEITLSNG